MRTGRTVMDGVRMKRDMSQWLGRVAMCLLAILMCLDSAALGETTGRGDLSQRFGDAVAFQYNGVSYRVRGRITTVLAMGTVRGQNPEAPEEATAELMYLLVVDDDAKIYTPVRLDSAMWVDYPSGKIQLRELYAKGGNPEEGCALIVQVLNEMLPDALIGSYAALDLERLTVIDGVEPGNPYDEEEYKARLHAIKDQAEQASTNDANEMFGALSGYIVTDMKSGAMMKVVDKADRYEGQPTVALPVIEERLPDGSIRVAPDEAAILPALLNVFYEEYTGW